MANHVLLDNSNHKDLKIISKRSASLGDNIPSLMTFPFEYRDIQTNFPIDTDLWTTSVDEFHVTFEHL